jgi:aminoglycoside 6'-N-acetyltransferase
MKTLTLTFTPLQEHSLPLLLEWLETPHVKAWWDQAIVWNMDLIKEKFGAYVHGHKKLMRAYIICADGKEIGYIQLYNAHDFPREDEVTLDELPNSLAAFDIFIGNPAYVGKGYGSQIMRQFLAEHIDPQYEACIVDPDTANVAAIRAYEKSGFEKIKMVKDGKVTLMIRKRPK